MSSGSENTQLPGSSNPIQNAVQPNDHGGSSPTVGDNTISGVVCDASVSIGSMVRMNGGTAVNALANNTTNSKVIGVCVEKTSATECSVLTTGFTGGIYGGLIPSENYFLSDSTPGGITTTPPVGAGTVVLHLGRAYNGNQLVVQIGSQIRRS